MTEQREILSDGSIFRHDPAVPVTWDRDVLTTRVPYPEHICPVSGDNLGGVFCSHEVPDGPAVSRPVIRAASPEEVEAAEVEASFRERRRRFDSIVLVGNPPPRPVSVPLDVPLPVRTPGAELDGAV